MSTAIPEDAPKPRLCHLKKRPDFNGYGFNLHAEKGKVGQYIGKVDAGSPAEKAHLKEGDRIVEVNGTNIGNENHSQVVQRIKAVEDETKMLVVDAEADNYYKEKKIVIRGDMSNVVTYCSDGSSESPSRITNGDAAHADASSAKSFDADAPQPRNCHLKIWPNFQGYGFNLHAEKGKPGQFIGKVDDNSPSELAGLKDGDRIIEVNGENIAKDNHAEVVRKIKSNPNQTTLLVLDPEAERYYKERDIVVSSKDSNVKNIYCPDTQPLKDSSSFTEAEVNHVSDKEEIAEVVAEYANVNKSAEPPTYETAVEKVEEKVEEKRESTHSDTGKVNGQTDGEEAAEAISESIREMEQAVADESHEEEPEKTPAAEPDKAELNNNADVAEHYDVISNVKRTEEEKTPEPSEPKEEASSPTKAPVTIAGITFAGSAKEARERMNKKKRDEIKQQQLTSKDKYNMYMKM